MVLFVDETELNLCIVADNVKESLFFFRENSGSF